MDADSKTTHLMNALSAHERKAQAESTKAPEGRTVSGVPLKGLCIIFAFVGVIILLAWAIT